MLDKQMLDKQTLDKHNQIYYTVFYTENKDIIDRIILDTRLIYHSVIKQEKQCMKKE